VPKRRDDDAMMRASLGSCRLVKYENIPVARIRSIIVLYV